MARVVSASGQQLKQRRQSTTNHSAATSRTSRGVLNRQLIGQRLSDFL